MRVLQVIPTLKRGGAERLALEITASLHAMEGITCKLVHFHSSDEYGMEYDDVEKHQIPVHVRPSVIGPWSVDVATWNQFLDEYDPHVVHSHLFEADLVAQYQPRKGVKYFSHCHDNMPQIENRAFDFHSIKQSIVHWYERKVILGQYNAVHNQFVSISNDTSNYFKANLPTSLKDRVHFLPNSIRTETFFKGTAIAPSNEEPLKILNVGSFVPKKNQQLAVRIAKELDKLNVNFQLTFAGDGAEIDNVRELATQLGIQDKVVFAGNVQNIEKLMWQSNVYLHTANYEPFGLVLLEAMASGLPVVTLDGQGNKDIVKHGKNGILLQEENPMHFSKELILLQTDENWWKRLSEAGKLSAQDYDISKYTAELIQLYSN